MRTFIATAASLFALVSAPSWGDVAAAPAKDPALAAAVAGDWRSAEHKARDPHRHPQESLQFWGLKPGMSVLEIQPGNPGWWTEILAPYAKATNGKYTATGADLANPELSAGARKSRAEFEATYAAKPDVYGKIELVNWGPKSAPLPADEFDLILTARSVHGWMGGGNYMAVDKAFREFHRALKPGGILAVEQHRAKPGPQGPKADGGYVTEAYVIEQAEKAGFKLEAKSEINANPKDTKDHPFGVWTLPPTRQSSEDDDKPAPAGFDRAKYDAIGESDRMTLRFRKAG
jgi:predicted methyltransferase